MVILYNFDVYKPSSNTDKNRSLCKNDLSMDAPCTYRKPNSNLLEADIKMLDILQSQTFSYFLKYLNPENGLIADKSKPDSHSSIAAVGLGISSYVVGVERNLISRGRGYS